MSQVQKQSLVEEVVDATAWQVWAVISDVTRIGEWGHECRAPWLLDRLYARLIPAHQDRDAGLAQDLVRVGVAARRGAQTRDGEGA